ncbi:MAG: hypothetical protein IJH12_09375 [Clostridia bacterium]|nr:hypothetical protein [Clostridia bacterium]
MKLMKKITSVISLVAILMVVLTFSGCGNEKQKEEKYTLVGSWKLEADTDLVYIYTFNDDGTGSYSYYGSELSFSYKDRGDKVSITFQGNTVESEFEYRIEGDSLIIKDGFGNDLTYKRQ